jgi:hypothetical protein
VLANTLVPVVSTAHPVVPQLIGITRQARTSSTARTYLTSEGSSMTRFTRVALHGSRGASTMPLRNPSLELHIIFSHASRWRTHHQAIEEVATSKSNKHHQLTTRSPSATRCNLMMQRTRVTLTRNQIALLQA